MLQVRCGLSSFGSPFEEMKVQGLWKPQIKQEIISFLSFDCLQGWFDAKENENSLQVCFNEFLLAQQHFFITKEKSLT